MSSKATSIDPAEDAKSVRQQQEPKVSSSSSNNNEQQEDELPQHWTKIASKKHPGKYYYFNVTTKESLWEHPGKTKALDAEKNIIRNVKASKEKSSPKSEKVIQLKNDTVQFKKKNLAKNRLEKLQKQLEVERKQDAGKKKVELEKVEKEAKTPETPKKKSPVKSSHVKETETEKTTPSRQKRKLVGSDNLSGSPSSRSKTSKLSPKSKVISKKVSPKVEQKKLSNAENTKKKGQEEPGASKILKSFKIPKKTKLESVSSSIFVDIQKLTEAKPVDSQSPKTDSIRSLPLKDPVPKERKKVPEAVAKSSPKVSYAQKLLEAIERPQASPSPRTVSGKAPAFTSTPKVQTLIRAEVDSPSFVKSPANERLVGIREKLAQEVALESTLLDEDAEMTDLSDALPQEQHSSVMAEAMDWEDIPEDVALREVVAVRQLPISKESVLDATIPGYGTQLFEQGHFQRYVLLVMDTNVFLSHLKGVERLLEKGFPHIGQPILIVPYIVLQELDRIKHREQGTPLSQAAARSIRFLNDHLKRRDPRVIGQSSMEAAKQLIPVENADDNIMNCCLQVRLIIAGIATDLMLLSNDVNLRNKALVNGIQAFGYGELMAEADRIRFAADEQIAGR
ncbi:transcriptional protein SWT1 [Ochlerotatus camptorhynchus]|uniref:transcriptional protein SWT1 n=1 Tax=Ochlerotatus camptorhynchus TaxID=644619 RepID=UPI0031D21891